MSDWKEVSWIEAANAFSAGTHDVQRGLPPVAYWVVTELFEPNDYAYRIREKVRTITVTIPLPRCATAYFPNALLEYNSNAERDNALAVIRAAIEGANDGR